MNLSDHTDSELLKAIRRNDEKAFAEFFKRYWKQVYTMAIARVRSEEATQEIVQDLFVSLWNKRENLNIANVPSYLFIATRNRVINYLSSELAVRKHWDHIRAFIPPTETSTDNQVELNDLMDALEKGMDGLPEKSKRIFKLNRLDGRSVNEIANILNLSEKAIQYHITQSVKKLRVHLKDYILIWGFVLPFLT